MSGRELLNKINVKADLISREKLTFYYTLNFESFTKFLDIKKYVEGGGDALQQNAVWI